MRAVRPLFVSLIALAAAACGTGDDPAPEGEAGPSAFELEHGMGPITAPVRLEGPVDQALAQRGEEIFQFNCEACHRMEDRFVGPPLGRVLERRTPAFVMNMILNPEQMAREHPVVREMLIEYPIIMPFQNITEEEARAILEYLRSVQR